MHLACWLCFVNSPLQCCYKETHLTSTNASRTLVVFCKLTLAIQIMRLIDRMFVVFCKSTLAIWLQRMRLIPCMFVVL